MMRYKKREGSEEKRRGMGDSRASKCVMRDDQVLLLADSASLARARCVKVRAKKKNGWREKEKERYEESKLVVKKKDEPLASAENNSAS